MDGDLGVLALSQLLQISSQTDEKRSNNNLVLKIRQIKAIIRNEMEFTKVYDLELIMSKENNLIFETIMEDDFLEWVFDTLEVYITSESDEKVIKWLLEFLTVATNLSHRFNEEILTLSNFLNVIHFFIKDKNLNENIIDFLICIIGNLIFSVDSDILYTDEIKYFLLHQSQSNLKVASICAWVKLASQTEINREETLICGLLPQLIRDLESCCKSEMLHSLYCSMDENLSFIEVMCKCEEAKKILSSNFKLLMILRLILRNNTFKEFIVKVNQLLPKLYSNEQVKHIEENVAASNVIS